ncbi:MAG: aspartate aminotransferase [Bacillota bacterium]|nr:MAG: aspartate aminotransferase [Bacillota bacterium]
MEATNRVKNIAPSLTLEITAKAKKMKAEGISVIGFGAGEPDFNTPDYINDAAKKAIDIGFTKYTPASGMPELKKAICAKFKKDNDLDFTEDQIVVSSGAKSSLYHAIEAIVEEGDEVLLPSPYWLTYPELIALAGGKTVYVPAAKENGYKVTAADLKKALTPKTKALIFNSPNNPTGAVYSEEEVKEIAKFAEESGIYVIADEIYEKLVYGGAKHYSVAQYSEKVKEQTIVINGVSKTYAMTGWRIGYLAAPKNVAKAIGSMQSHTASNPCSIAQYATVAALSGGEDFIEKMNKTFDERRRYMYERMCKMRGVACAKPDGAFYVFADVSALFGKTFDGEKIEGSMQFASAALKKGVALIPGIAFGDDNSVRLSYAISMEDIKEGLDRLESFINELK